MISSNYGGYNNRTDNVSYGAVKDVVPEQYAQKLPENVQNATAADIANQNDAVAMAGSTDKTTLTSVLPIYLGLVGIRTLNDHVKAPFSFSGEYDKSVLGKVTNLGDKISNTVSKIVPKKVKEGAPKKLNGAKNWLVEHFATARALTTPVKLESTMALQEANGMFGRIMFDNAEMFEKGYKGDVKKLFKGNGNGAFWEYLKDKGIETAKEPAKVVSESFRELAKEPVKGTVKTSAGNVINISDITDDIIKKLSKSNEKIVIDKWGKFPVGKIPGLGKLLKLEVPMSEISNKLRANTGAKTALGGLFGAVFTNSYESLTNNYAGGKLGPLMQAYFLATSISSASKAPKGQKVATFMDEEAGGVAALLVTPLATKIVTELGGLKYIGMGKTGAEQKANVSKYREMVKNLNARVDAKTISRGEYVDEVKNIKKVFKGDTKWWQKPIKALGKIAGSNYDAETVKPFIDDVVPADTKGLKTLGNSFMNKFKNFSYKLRSGKFAGFTPGGILRAVLVMFVLTPILSKPIKWVVNKIFGKPYDSDKEKEDTKNKAKEEELKNNPFYNMDDKELTELISKNQDLFTKVQNDPALAQELQSDPQKLYTALVEGAKKKDEALKNAPASPMLQNYKNRVAGNSAPQSVAPANRQTPPAPSTNINQPGLQLNMEQNQTINSAKNMDMPAPSVQDTAAQTDTKKTIEPERTYIPSSKPADFQAQKTSEDERFQAILADMDATEKEYSKYLSL